jgi:hypothetical protein
MKKICFCICCVMLVLLLSGCSLDEYLNGSKQEQYYNNESENIINNISKDLPTKQTINLKDYFKFDWDVAYILDHYLTNEEFKNLTGKEIDIESNSETFTDDNIKRILFVKNDKLVFDFRFNIGVDIFYFVPIKDTVYSNSANFKIQKNVFKDNSYSYTLIHIK